MGVFATRKLNPGKVIIDEYPLLTLGPTSVGEFETNHYPFIDEETKAKILPLHDRAEDFKIFDSNTIEEMINKEPSWLLFKEAEDGEMNKIVRNVFGNFRQICEVEDLYGNTQEVGLYQNFSRINHSCVPNATVSWVMGDFKRSQVRAMMPIKQPLYS